MSIVYRGYTQRELDAQYEQRTLVPNVADYVDHWRLRGAQARTRAVCRCDVPYGAGSAERLDIYFPAAGNAPIHMHFHGGAWRMLSKDDVAYPAPLFTARGAVYIAAGFPLAVDAPLSEMVASARRALAWTHRNARELGGDGDRIFVSGFSSGAHLAAMLLADDGWRAGAAAPRDAVRGAVLMSGIYDLEPVRLSKRNDLLALDTVDVEALSPIRLLPAGNGPAVTVLWGAGELDEFRRQSRTFADAWAAAGNPVRAAELPERNHFDMASDLGEQDSAVFTHVSDQMDLPETV